jgi:hypothetical protein
LPEGLKPLSKSELKVGLTPRLFFMSSLCERSEDLKVDLDFEIDGDGFAFAGGGFESILLHGFDGLLVQPIAQASRDAHVLWLAVRVNDERDEYIAGELGLFSGFGILRVGRVGENRRVNGSADLQGFSVCVLRDCCWAEQSCRESS